MARLNRSKQIPLIERTPDRVCWSCQHLNFSNAESGYSEYTPGSEFGLECGKQFWWFDAHTEGVDAFRANLQTAETCGAFEPRPVRT